MTQNYLSGRVNRFAVGVPGFSTSGDLTLDVSGALGIGTTQPRAEADVPNISIREQLLDSSGEEGPLGYFLSADADGVRWIAASPTDLTFIRVYDNGAQPGFSSVSGLNFVAKDDDDFITLTPNSGGDPNIVDINFDVRWIKRQYGDNYGIATGFGTDGTYASIPGFGTSEAVGVTSVGIGTDEPQDDLQVGIGSTGVTLNGPTGTVKAVTGAFKNLRIDGNISAESLLITPGISTFGGPIDAQGVSTFSDRLDVTGIASIAELEFTSGIGSFFRAGIATFGVGVSSDTFTVVKNNLQVNGITTLGDISNPRVGLTTVAGDLYVGNDFFVGGELFVKQLNAENASITGIATINNIDGNVGVFTDLQVSGVTTLAQVGFDTAIGGEISAGQIISGILTTTDLVASAATIGFATMTDVFVSGTATVTKVDVEEIEIEQAQVGILTVSEGLVNQGLSTFVGFSTFGDDIYVAGFGTFGEGVDIPFVQVEDLIVSGIATVAELDLNVGIASTLYVADLGVGIGTFEELIAEEGDIGGVDFEGGGEIAGTNLDFDTGRIGILTGDNLVYQIGTITQFDSRVAGIDTLTGQNLQYTGLSQINGATFRDDQLEVDRNFQATGIVTLGRPDVDPTVGLTTVSGDLYVGNDLIVAGELSFEQLTGENLFLTGIATIFEAEINTGIATFIEFEGLEVTGIATVQTFIGVAATITDLNSGTIVNDSTIRTRDLQVEQTAQVGDSLFVPTANISAQLNANNVEITGVSTIAEAIIDSEQVSISTITDLTVTGIATIREIDVEFIDAERSNTGIATIADLVVTNSADFQGDVVVDIGGTANINNANITFANIAEEVVGTSTVGFLDATDANIGVATVGLVSATSAEIDDLDVATARIGVSTTGYAEIGIGATTDRALLVTGVSTFIGFTTFSGDVFVDGDFTVTGIASYNQLDAKQSQIGILTVGTRLDSNGTAEFENVAITTGLTVSGFTTLTGFTTTSDVIVGGALTVVGDTTFLGIVSITDTVFINQEVTGISTVNNLLFNSGIGTQLSVGVLTAGDVTVNGPSTFVGNVDIFSDLDVLGKITTNELGVSGLATFTDINVSSAATIGFASITNELVGVSTIGFASITDTLIGVATIGRADIGVLEIENLLVTGVSTFIGVATFSDIRYRNSESTGISTFNIIDTTEAEIDIATITSAAISEAFIGLSSVGFSTIGFGSTTESALFVTGLSTFSGFTTFRGDVFVGGALTVTGIASYGQLDAQQSQIGILTVGTDLDVEGTFSVIGFSTLGDFSANTGVVTFLDAEDVNVSGSLTAVELNVTDLEVQRNLLVGGISTLGSANTITGFTTVASDLYVGGNLYVKDDIFKDEITGRNMLITGVGTVNELYVNSGFTTTQLTENLTASVGVITSLAGYAGTYTEFNVTNLVSGTSTFTGITTFQDKVFSNSDIETTETIFAQNVRVSDTIVANTGFVTTLTVDESLTVLEQTLLNNVRITGVTTFFGDINASAVNAQIGIATITELFTTTITNSGVITSTNIYASNNIEAAQGLISKNTLTVEGLSFLQGDVTVDDGGTDAGILVTQGNITIADGVFVGPALDVSYADIGIALTATSAEFNFVEIDGGLNVNVGVSSFFGPVFMDQDLFVAGTVFANSGILTNLTVNENITANTGIFTGQLNTADINSTGIVTAQTGDFIVLEATTFNLGVGTINNAEISIGDVDTLRVNSGFATNFTINAGGTLDTQSAQTNLGNTNVSGIITTQQLIVSTNARISGILTVDQQLDHTPNATTTDARRFQTTSVAPSQMLYQVPSGYTSAEFTITGVEGTNFHSTKIHALNTGSAVFFNEYSNVFNNTEVGEYEVILNGSGMDLVVTPNSANATNYTIHVVAHKA